MVNNINYSLFNVVIAQNILKIVFEYYFLADGVSTELANVINPCYGAYIILDVHYVDWQLSVVIVIINWWLSIGNTHQWDPLFVQTAGKHTRIQGVTFLTHRLLIKSSVVNSVLLSRQKSNKKCAMPLRSVTKLKLTVILLRYLN